MNVSCNFFQLTLRGLCIRPSPSSLLTDSPLIIQVIGNLGGSTLHCTIPSGLKHYKIKQVLAFKSSNTKDSCSFHKLYYNFLGPQASMSAWILSYLGTITFVFDYTSTMTLKQLVKKSMCLG